MTVNLWLSAVNNPMGVSMPLLKELVRTYDPDILRARLVEGHPGWHDEKERASIGVINRIWLDGETLYGECELTDTGEALLRSGTYAYVSIAFTCIVVDPDQELPDWADPHNAIDLGDGTYGLGNQYGPDGELVGGTGVYLNHVAVLGGTDPAIPGQPLLVEQIN